ncbi:unnamed protein product [Arabidopsis lyrata]|uniref:Predicted protein n=1 Tax=Arabidopsis lyrata subsp. lyrata TaxID=81972 RepID=D7L2N6_ARALL|nr:predicted protein [Arabidopsis lyrata subsp. lyrata]CAH8262224.1 unnamed protein product [Arabidopsis lyrata]
MNLSRKIDDLHLSLNRFSAFHDRDSYSTLKDSTARVKTHFRSYFGSHIYISLTTQGVTKISNQANYLSNPLFLAKPISLLKLFLEKLHICFCNLIQFRFLHYIGEKKLDQLKPLFFKNLSKVFQCFKGYFASNTIFIDDGPHY